MRLFGLEIRSAAQAVPVSDNRGGWWPIIRESVHGRVAAEHRVDD
jgi:hypothetical protein